MVLADLLVIIGAAILMQVAIIVFVRLIDFI